MRYLVVAKKARQKVDYPQLANTFNLNLIQVCQKGKVKEKM